MLATYSSFNSYMKLFQASLYIVAYILLLYLFSTIINPQGLKTYKVKIIKDIADQECRSALISYSTTFSMHIFQQFFNSYERKTSKRKVFTLQIFDWNINADTNVQNWYFVCHFYIAVECFQIDRSFNQWKHL